MSDTMNRRTETLATIPTLVDLQAMPVHPIAAMFPMLGDDELAEMAADIAANGVNHPVVVSRDGILIDGRNRLAACALAKVEPPVVYFEGEDPSAFIISENVNRRHLSKSQRAMATAKAFPKTQQGKRSSLEIKEVNGSMLSQARSVLRLAPDRACALSLRRIRGSRGDHDTERGRGRQRDAYLRQLHSGIASVKP